MSSYPLTIKAIINTRQQRTNKAKSTPSSDAVLVSIPHAKDLGQMPHVTSEVDAVWSICHTEGIPIVQPEAVQGETLEALRNCRFFHFAGHGGIRLDPLESLLYFKDWKKPPLTLASLLDTNLSAAAPFLAHL